MHKHYDLLDMDLALFDGGAAGDGGGDGSGTGGTQANHADTQRGTSGGAAEDAAKTGSDAGSGQQQDKAETRAEREARYKAMVGGEFKDLFTADTQRIINERFKETRGLQESLEAQRPVMDFLTAKYKAADPAGLMAAMQADDSLWQAMADAAGKTVEQFKTDWISDRQREAMEAELKQSRQELFFRRQMGIWEGEAKTLQETYPDFDLAAEVQDKDFLGLLRSGVPMRLAYEVKHMPDIIAGVQKAAADEREKAVTESIRARGGRPAENGASAQNGVATGVDVSKLTRQQRSDIAKRVARGETITFQ